MTDQTLKVIIAAEDKGSGVFAKLGAAARATGVSLVQSAKAGDAAFGVFAAAVRGSLGFELPKHAKHAQESLADVAKSAHRVGDELRHVEQHAGLERLREGAHRAGERFRELRHHIIELLPMLGALGAVGSAGGIVEAIRKTAEFGSELHEASQKTGLTVESLARLHYAAGLSGVATDQLDTALGRLNRTIGDAVTGKNKEAARIFRALHISLKDSHGHIKDAAEIFPKLAEGIKRNENPVVRARIGFSALGKPWEELIPLLARGAGGLEELGNEFDALHGKMSDEKAEAAHKFSEDWKRLGVATGGLADAIGDELMPELDKQIISLRDWIAANRDLIATNVRKFLTELAKDLPGIAKDIGTIARELHTGVTELGGWKSVGETVLAFFATKWTLGMLGSIARVAAALRGVQAAGAGAGALGAAGGLGVSGPAAAIALTAGVGILSYRQLKDNADRYIRGEIPDGWDPGSGSPVYLTPASRVVDESGRIVQRPLQLHHAVPADELEGSINAGYRGLPTVRAGGWRAIGDAAGIGSRTFGLGELIPLPPPLPSAAAASSARVVVEFENMPPGADVKRVDTTGNPNLELKIGRAMGH